MKVSYENDQKFTKGDLLRTREGDVFILNSFDYVESVHTCVGYEISHEGIKSTEVPSEICEKFTGKIILEND